MLVEINRVSSFYNIPSPHKRLICAINQMGQRNGLADEFLYPPSHWRNEGDKRKVKGGVDEFRHGGVITEVRGEWTFHAMVCYGHKPRVHELAAECFKRLEIPPEETLVLMLYNSNGGEEHEVMDVFARSDRPVIVYIIK